MNGHKRNWHLSINDTVLITSASLAAIITLLDFLGLLDGVEWLKSRVPTMTLLAIAIVLTATVVDRHTTLARIEKLLQRSMDIYGLGVEYLEDSANVIRELDLTVRKADEFVMAIGAKSTALDYLDSIARQIGSGRITYHRLLTGDHITHELHTHLNSVLDAPGAKIAWNRSEKYGNLTMSEQQVLLVLPTPHWNRFTAIKLPGERNARLYSQYFLEAFAEGVPVYTKKAICALCEKCGRESAGNEQRLNEILRKELEGNSTAQIEDEARATRATQD